MRPAPALPPRVFLVRHGESAGNVARTAAEAAGLETIDIEGRDVDVPLSARGVQQAEALARWFEAQPASERPTVILTSPYARARQTAERIRGVTLVMDERLREKEFGSFNRLTRAGIVAKFPHEASLRTELGKFYYRPPGGESWCDVLLRLRSVLADLELRYHDERVLIVAHQVIVLCFRYLFEGLDEAALLAIDREKDVANCSVTKYERRGDRLELAFYDFVAPLEEAGAEVTHAPDLKGPAR